MNYSKRQQWEQFKKFYTDFPTIRMAVDLSRMNIPDAFFPSMEVKMQKAFDDMAALEKGDIANPDENRMVGHYWLRDPELAPTVDIRREIMEAINRIKQFAERIHSGAIRGSNGQFKNYLLIGIGGSALGPQFVANALGHHLRDRLRPHFLDNTDPDGIERVLASLHGELGQTLCIVISKSGGTMETRNGMFETEAAYRTARLDFGKHCIAITQQGSELDRIASKGGWLERFPMWDWVGGRTSVMSAVGLLPAVLQGINIDELLAGAKRCDCLTRLKSTTQNPAAQLALAWFYSGNGKGEKSMVVIPYKDRLELFSKYLQQLIMESLGKELDLNRSVVNQGIAVFGNKGSTDQHSYIQQLRDGINNFFVTFIEVLRDREMESLEVEPGVTSGDYLNGFLLGTREALFQSGRSSVTITVKEVSALTIGALIAIFERAVGLYASLVNVNAYHQPGVEAGKKAAAAIIELQRRVMAHLSSGTSNPMSADEISTGIGAADQVEHVFKVCEHLSSNPSRGLIKLPGQSPFESRYQKS